MATAALTGLASLLSNQSRSGDKFRGSRPQLESQTAIIASVDKKRLKEVKKQADKERLYNLLTQPEVMGLGIIFGGIIASQYLPFSPDPVTNAGLKSLATTSSVLVGLGHAGVGDLTTLLIAGGSGVFSLFGDLGVGKAGGFAGKAASMAESGGEYLLGR